MEPWVLYLLGFVSCALLIWLHHKFADCVLGHGMLSGQGKVEAIGHYVATSRGNVHYVYLDGQQEHVPVDDREGLDVGLISGAKKEGQVLGFGQADEDRLVVIVHGFAGSNDAFVCNSRSGYAHWLNSHGYSVLAFDLYGHGHSDGPDTAYTGELFAEQLAELCLIFGLHKPFDLVGFSMGGSIALVFAKQYPNLVRRLVLQSPHVVEAPLRFSLQIALRIPFFREAISAVIIPTIGECRDNPAALRASFRLLLTRLHGGGRWTAPGKGGSTKEMLKEIDRKGVIPLYLIWGEKDSVVSFSQAKKLCKLAPSCKLISHPDADHMSFADGSEEIRTFFRDELLDILSNV